MSETLDEIYQIYCAFDLSDLINSANVRHECWWFFTMLIHVSLFHVSHVSLVSLFLFFFVCVFPCLLFMFNLFSFFERTWSSEASLLRKKSHAMWPLEGAKRWIQEAPVLRGTQQRWGLDAGSRIGARVAEDVLGIDRRVQKKASRKSHPDVQEKEPFMELHKWCIQGRM